MSTDSNDSKAPALEFRNVSRTYDKGKFTAVNDVSLTVEPAQIHALIGPNGAGKTTLVKMAASILDPTRGEVIVNGHNVTTQSQQARRDVGLALGGELGFYPRANAIKNLRFFANVAGIPAKNIPAETERVLEAVGLSQNGNQKVNSFSRGMVQRLHIARALLGHPALLVMDEPTNGLDPDIALSIRALLKDLANNGHAVFLTSHTMSEIEDVSHVISVIGAGRIHFTGGLTEVVNYAGVTATTTATIHAGDTEIVEALRSQPQVKELRQSPKGARWGLTVFWESGQTPAQIQAEVQRIFREHSIEIPNDLVTRQPTLEEAYLSLAGELKRT
ncbi:ABC transporter ATP-binding protein [Pseudoglutamicibacter cumminsii]|uniref:ABC transporter ATP-binding protein n=1 Tax=Pseudoglutamicibacter cumminsii TaxID=156979 RepID=A0AAP4C6J5_9MICC|nr:ABC transporter ATP-binding protein [Pseudoglutamicibacter cumminsii]MDK6274996.1 ABC transporter ATP-binding protein [Pseudoglutamicibacter cumminsii]